MYTDSDETASYGSACGYISRLIGSTRKHDHAHTRECLARLGNPERAFRCIHVAGTNGKGSVCAYLSAVLKKAGIRHGVLTSPHLVTIRERIALDGEMISEEAFVGAYRKVRAVSESMENEGREHPSFYEFLFLMAMVCFAEQKVQTAVVETGLGGLHDVTNVLTDPYLAVITSISRDHEKQLGSTIREIAAHKAGILKERIPVVYDPGEPEAAEVIREEAEKKACPAYPVPTDLLHLDSADRSGIVCSMAGRFEGDGALRIRIPAPYQRMNAACAVTACDVLRSAYPEVFSGITDGRIREGIASMTWPCRMEELLDGVFVDGAHNVGGIRAFAEAASAVAAGRPYGLLFAAAADKAYPEMIGILCRYLKPAYVVTTEIPNVRRAAAHRTAEVFRRCGISEIEEIPDAEEAFLRACERKGDGFLFCAGSLYLAGTIRNRIRRNRS